jgi:hypothetical protein
MPCFSLGPNVAPLRRYFSWPRVRNLKFEISDLKGLKRFRNKKFQRREQMFRKTPLIRIAQERAQAGQGVLDAVGPEIRAPIATWLNADQD